MGETEVYPRELKERRKPDGKHCSVTISRVQMKKGCPPLCRMSGDPY